jgi:hypothetical protein
MKRTTLKHSRLFIVLAAVFLAGCTTSPEKRAANEQQRAVEREQNERRHEIEQRRNAEEDLRHKFARYSTAELKLMDTRYKDLRQSSGRDVNLTLRPVDRLILGDSDKHNVEHILEIERELLRRWKAGDAEAYLPEFEPSAPESKK